MRVIACYRQKVHVKISVITIHKTRLIFHASVMKSDVLRKIRVGMQTLLIPVYRARLRLAPIPNTDSDVLILKPNVKCIAYTCFVFHKKRVVEPLKIKFSC